MTDAAVDTFAEGADPLTRVADDLEKIAAHLVPFLKASYGETQERLKRAERVIAARQERPAIAGMHGILSTVRRLEPGAEVRELVEESLLSLLEGLGYQEFGSRGDPYDPTRHEPLGGQTEKGRGRLVRVHRKGLACYDDVMIRALVEVEPFDDGFPLPADDVFIGQGGTTTEHPEGR